MHRLTRSVWLSAFVLTAIALKLQAQEFTIMPVGDMSLSSFQHSTFAWDVDYRFFVTQNFAFSEAYLNEGKVDGHRRDGYATEFWGNLPIDLGRFSLSAGAGVYNFYDTQPAGSDSIDFHGTAPIVSLSATTYLFEKQRFFLRFTFNRVMPAHDIKTNTFLVGAGVWLGKGDRPQPIQWNWSHPLAAGESADRELTPNEVTLYYGQSTVNTLRNEKAASAAIEYRHGVFPYLDAVASWIYEGDPKIIRRNGVALQLCPVNTFTFGSQRVSVGMGLGAYGYIDRKHRLLPGQNNQTALAALVSPVLSWDFSRSWSARAVMHRVVTDNNRDSDVFLGGLAYRWGH